MKVAAPTMGLFALTEMMILYTRGKAIAGSRTSNQRKEKGARVIDGVIETAKNWKYVLQGGTIGAVAGIIPGMGGTVAMFGSYAYVKSRSKDPASFGKGNPLGVLAPESANNAKEGGSFVPTLTFGIPGTTGMALVIAILITMGYTPGPDMITKNLDVVFYIAWIIALSNILASVIGIFMAPGLSMAAFLRPAEPAGTRARGAGSHRGVHRRAPDDGVLVAVIFGVIGYVFRVIGYSAAVAHPRVRARTDPRPQPGHLAQPVRSAVPATHHLHPHAARAVRRALVAAAQGGPPTPGALRRSEVTVDHEGQGAAR